jgi:hypothetical protein
MPAPDSPAPERAALPGDEAAVTAAYSAPPPAEPAPGGSAEPAPGTVTAAPATTAPAVPGASPVAASPVTVEAVRRVHVSEDWLATVVGLSIVAVGLLGLIPEGLVP